LRESRGFARQFFFEFPSFTATPDPVSVWQDGPRACRDLLLSLSPHFLIPLPWKSTPSSFMKGVTGSRRRLPRPSLSHGSPRGVADPTSRAPLLRLVALLASMPRLPLSSSLLSSFLPQGMSCYISRVKDVPLCTLPRGQRTPPVHRARFCFFARTPRARATSSREFIFGPSTPSYLCFNLSIAR